MHKLRWCWLVASILVTLYSSAASAQISPRAEAIAFWDDHTPDSGLRPDHSPWQKILDTYLVVDDPSGVNLFDYDRVSEEDDQRLIEYLTYLQELDPRQLTKPRQMAYWINIYNATLVAYIVSAKPGRTIRGLRRGDFWDLNRFNIAGQQLSFNDIEHGILRPLFRDQRIHFALFRGSIGSANLAEAPYVGETIDEDLERAGQAFISHPRAVSLNGNELRLSRLFKWKEDDFGASTEGVKVFIKQYMSAEQAQQLDSAERIRYQFDWTLNKPN